MKSIKFISVSNKKDDDYKMKDSLKGSVFKYDNPIDPVITSDDFTAVAIVGVPKSLLKPL